jgi:hypothetical protein
MLKKKFSNLYFVNQCTYYKENYDELNTGKKTFYLSPDCQNWFKRFHLSVHSKVCFISCPNFAIFLPKDSTETDLLKCVIIT